jgi:predicted DNA repair protein MutK
MILQVLLAAGFPLGQFAWRGQYRVLPSALRWASLVAAGVLGMAAWVVLARAGLVGPGADLAVVPVATRGFVGFFCLNTVGNIASRSLLERLVMTPVTLLLTICFIAVALSPLEMVAHH